MGNIIPARFDTQFFDHVSGMIRQLGIKCAINYMFVDVGLHPAFIGAAVRKVMRERGW